MHKFFSSKHIITLSLAVILILIFSITSISLYRLHALYTHLEIINQHSCVKKQLLQTMLSKSRERLLAIQRMQATDDIFARQETYNHFNLLASDFIRARDSLITMLVSENERRLAKQALLLVTEVSTRQYEAALILLEDGDAQLSLEHGIIPIHQALHDTLQQLIDLQQHTANEYFNYANEIYRADWYLIPLLAGFGILLSIYSIIVVFIRIENLENSLAKSQHEAIAAGEARDNFWANLSHDLRTPLNAVTNMSQLLLDTPLNPEQKELVMTINHSGDSFLKLIDGVLDFSKLEASRLILSPQIFELRQLIAQLIDIADNRAKLKNLEVTLLYDDKIPTYLLGDKHRLAQIIEHLLSNAIKFTERGEILLSLTARRPNEFNACDNCIELYVMVKDSGIGIPLEQRDNLFEPYVYSNRRHRGTGISLALCKRLCELMGGTLWIEGESGSSFHFTVLLDIPTDNQFMTTVDQPFSPISNLRILLVEDEFTSQKVAQLVLRKLGYEIDIVNDGAKGVEAVRQCLYDIVLMDVQMPELDGFAASKAIISAWIAGQRPYIIAMTAHALDEDRERCLAGGMDDYISKPITAEELQAAIARWQQWRAKN